jgi:hypothetical protein
MGTTAAFILSRKVERHVFVDGMASIAAGVTMHLYRLVIGTIWFHQLLSVNSGRATVAFPQAQLSSILGLLHSLIAATVVVLDRILPTISALMPERAPLVICLLGGCNALALRIPYRSERSACRQAQCNSSGELYAL